MRDWEQMWYDLKCKLRDDRDLWANHDVRDVFTYVLGLMESTEAIPKQPHSPWYVKQRHKRYCESLKRMGLWPEEKGAMYGNTGNTTTT
jgi:hypothetical protein